MPVAIKKGQNEWTESQRLALHLLHTDFDFDEATRTSIFNTVFKNELARYGLESGLKHVPLKSQYRDRYRKGRGYLWANILRNPQTDDERAEREQLLGRIRDAAANLGVDDVQKEESQDGAENPAGAAMNEYGPAEPADDEIERELEAELDEYPATNLDRQPTAPSQPADDNSLDMLHYEYLKATEDGPYIDSVEDALVDHSSPVYKFGGPVHLVSITSENKQAAFMICNRDICAECFDFADPSLPSQTAGLPLVHSSDTVREAGRTYFRPAKPNRYSTNIPKTYNRHVHFRGWKGDVACWVKICGNIGCDICLNGRYGEESEDDGGQGK